MVNKSVLILKNEDDGSETIKLYESDVIDPKINKKVYPDREIKSVEFIKDKWTETYRIYSDEKVFILNDDEIREIIDEIKQ